jgi:hypothetical protein
MYRSDVMGVQEVVSGKEVNEQHMYLFYGREMKIINQGPNFLYNRELYQQLNELNLLVIGCNI